MQQSSVVSCHKDSMLPVNVINLRRNTMIQDADDIAIFEPIVLLRLKTTHLKLAPLNVVPISRAIISFRSRPLYRGLSVEGMTQRVRAEDNLIRKTGDNGLVGI